MTEDRSTPAPTGPARWGLPPGGIEGPTGRAAIRRLDSIAIPECSDAEVVAAMVVMLARTIDAASAKGQAASVANAAREMVGGLDRLTAELAPPTPVESPSERAARMIAEALGADDGDPTGPTPSLLA